MDRLNTGPQAAAQAHGDAPPAHPFAALQAGRPWPMGATVDNDAGGPGVNIAVFSANATQVDLCLYDDTGRVELARLPLPAHTGDIWHGRLPGAGAGLIYGLRAHGPWRPDRGHRFNPNKLLLDPWAREIVGAFHWHGPHFGADRDHPQHMDTQDNGRDALKARVVDDHFDWQGDTPPATPLADSVIYEMHTSAFSKLLPGVPDAQRGSYAAVGSDAAIAHFKRLGITAVSLLPVQQILDEERLFEMGLTNHWGYNTLGFFCPDPRYASTDTPRDEFRTMVRRLHAAGLEVLLDVVYNHTPEGSEGGPTLSWRGLDNASWYRLPADHRGAYDNWSGCGNTLNVNHPRVLQMVLDSLRYWVDQMHVDGFRFDLAPVLGRGRGLNGEAAFENDGPFFKAVLQDPVLQRVKMIAEPWDIGPGGYQVGNFPRGWLEWNDHFRDTARAFWLGDCSRGEFALRLAGSSDLFQARRRSPLESVNYIVSHDGFTLADLVSYNERHNEANGEDNRDGHGNNLSWNCGAEGSTDDPAVNARRARLQRALLATLLLSQGTPMLAAGDELGHSQGGNNNPYCQDNAITWIDWSKADDALINFTAHVLAVRKRLLPLGTQWYTGLADAHGQHDLAWLRRTGDAMTPEYWDNRTSRILGAWVCRPGRAGTPLLLLVNGRDMDASFQLPRGDWVAEVDTTAADGRSSWRRNGAEQYELPARSMLLLRDDGPAARVARTTQAAQGAQGAEAAEATEAAKAVNAVQAAEAPARGR